MSGEGENMTEDLEEKTLKLGFFTYIHFFSIFVKEEKMTINFF